MTFEATRFQPVFLLHILMRYKSRAIIMLRKLSCTSRRTLVLCRTLQLQYSASFGCTFSNLQLITIFMLRIEKRCRDVRQRQKVPQIGWISSASFFFYSCADNLQHRRCRWDHYNLFLCNFLARVERWAQEMTSLNVKLDHFALFSLVQAQEAALCFLFFCLNVKLIDPTILFCCRFIQCMTQSNRFYGFIFRF